MSCHGQTLHYLKAWHKVNPKNFLFLIHDSRTKTPQDCKLNIIEIFIIFTKSTSLLGITISNKL